MWDFYFDSQQGAAQTHVNILLALLYSTLLLFFLTVWHQLHSFNSFKWHHTGEHISHFTVIIHHHHHRYRWRSVNSSASRPAQIWTVLFLICPPLSSPVLWCPHLASAVLTWPLTDLVSVSVSVPEFTEQPSQLKGYSIHTRLSKGPRGFGFNIVGGSRPREFLQVYSVTPGGPPALNTGTDTVYNTATSLTIFGEILLARYAY